MPVPKAMGSLLGEADVTNSGPKADVGFGMDEGTVPGGANPPDPHWGHQMDPPMCPACNGGLEAGHMVCPSCGSYILRTRYPLNGVWNRRVEGIAVSGWGFSLMSGDPVSVTFTAHGPSVESGGREIASFSWTDVVDMAVDGPGTQSIQRFGLMPILDLSDPLGSAVLLGVSHVVGRLGTKTDTETYFVILTDEATLVLLNTHLDRQALRWLLEPAFTSMRIAAARKAQASIDHQIERLGRRTEDA